MKAAFPLRSAPLIHSTPGARPVPGGRRFWLIGALVGSAFAAPAAAQAPAARYPLDPVCPWGRLADGHGLLVRCLERGEAQSLLLAGAVSPTGAPPAPGPAVPRPAVPAPAAMPPPAVPPAAAPPPAPYGALPAGAPRPAAGMAPAPPHAAFAPASPAAAFPSTGVHLPPATAGTPPAVPPSSVPSPAAAGAPAAVPPLVAAAPAAPTTPRSTKIHRKVSVREVGAAVADTGELPEAQVQLRKVLDRYAQCVVSNGGLEGEQGRVTVRFLVRERGRAEGVAVKERQGVSLAAAKCVAEVVDRRFVGYPAAPIVGATLSIDFMPEGAAR